MRHTNYLTTGARAAGVSTEANLKVAFIGDQGLGSNAEKVLGLIKSEGAAAVVHAGDFEYKNSPSQFDAQVEKVLGTSIPYFGSPGNHDTANWGGTGGYKEVLSRRSGSYCTGDYGSQAYCNFKGLGIMLLGVGTTVKKDDAAQISFIKTAAAGNTWKICDWHKNQNAMQVGGKGDEVGWGAFEACREAGAIIMTGHEHSYHRTKTLTSMTNQTVDGSCNSAGQECIGPGKTFVVVSGIAGNDVRDQQRCLPVTAPYGCKGEWAKIYTSSQGATFGALFVVFNYNGDPNKAHGYFKNINGAIVDEFDIVTSGGTGPVATNTPGAGVTNTPPAGPTATIPAGCSKKSSGDADCNGTVDISDFEQFRKEYTGQVSSKTADFDGDGSVTISDFETWRKGYFANGGVTLAPTTLSTNPSPTTPQTTGPPGQVFRAFTANSYWNSPIPATAHIDPKSAQMIAYIKATNPKPYIQFSGLNPAGDWGRPIYFSKASDPVYNVACTNQCPPELKAVHIPANARSDDPTSDAEMTIYDPVVGAVFGMWQAHKTNNTWRVVSSSIHYYSSAGIDGKWTGMPGADTRNSGHRGAPASTIGIRLDEIQAGSIPHKLDLYIVHTKNTHVFPYVGDEDGTTDPNAPPEGALIRIKPSVNINALNIPRAAKIIATSLQTYGAVIGDQTGSSMALKVENAIKEGKGDVWPSILSNTDLQAIPIDNFEIIQLGYGCTGSTRCSPVEQP